MIGRARVACDMTTGNAKEEGVQQGMLQECDRGAAPGRPAVSS